MKKEIDIEELKRAAESLLAIADEQHITPSPRLEGALDELREAMREGWEPWTYSRLMDFYRVKTSNRVFTVPYEMTARIICDAHNNEMHHLVSR
jgi:hypothetical protein